MSKYPLASRSWDHRELEAIQTVIDQNMFTMGKCVADYEKCFADFFVSKYAVMVSSGSAANLLMISSLFYTRNEAHKLKRGDEVIVPAVSWSTTYFPLQQYGLKVKFVDIDPDTLNINLIELENAITDKTRAILAVNLLGNPNDFGAIKKLVAGRNIILLEDNCESMGAMIDHKLTGTFGIMGTFSSFFSHHISTMEGGCILTDDEELYHFLLCMRAHGWTRDLPKKNLVSGKKSDDRFEELFKFVLPGYNVRPLEMSGAIGIEQIKKLPDFINKRRENADYFQNLFTNHPFLTIQKEVGVSSWFGFSLVIKKGVDIERKKITSLLMDNGIECRPIVSGNFTKNEVINYFDHEIFGVLENAEYMDKNGIFVGNHHVKIEEMILHLKNTLDKFIP